MKKIVVGIVLGTLLISITGCEKNTDESENSVYIEEAQVDDESEVTNDEVQQDAEEIDKLPETGITVESIKNMQETDASAFEYENTEGGISITGYIGNNEIIIIPEQIDGQVVIEIADSTFFGNEEIKAIKIANSITRLGQRCFGNCYNLEIVICGENLRLIDEYAFNYCKSLHTMELNTNLETLARLCLGGTHNLKEIYIPASVVTVDVPVVPSETNVTIITEAGSAAEQYAIENGIPYELK